MQDGVSKEAQIMMTPESKGEKKDMWMWDGLSESWEQGAGSAKVRRAWADHGWNPHLDWRCCLELCD